MIFLVANGIDFINSKLELHWHGVFISLLDEPPMQSMQASNLHTKASKDNTSQPYTCKEVATYRNQQHLNDAQRKELKAILRDFKDIFQGRFGTFKDLEVDLDLKEDAEAF